MEVGGSDGKFPSLGVVVGKGSPLQAARGMQCCQLSSINSESQGFGTYSSSDPPIFWAGHIERTL